MRHNLPLPASSCILALRLWLHSADSVHQRHSLLETRPPPPKKPAWRQPRNLTTPSPSVSRPALAPLLVSCSAPPPTPHLASSSRSPSGQYCSMGRGGESCASVMFTMQIKGCSSPLFTLGTHPALSLSLSLSVGATAAAWPWFSHVSISRATVLPVVLHVTELLAPSGSRCKRDSGDVAPRYNGHCSRKATVYCPRCMPIHICSKKRKKEK